MDELPFPKTVSDVEDLVSAHCTEYASAMEAIETKDEANYADLITRYADTDGVFRNSARSQALAEYDEINHKSEAARRIEWVTTGRGCVEDLASMLCEIEPGTFTPEIKQLLELSIRAYNVMAMGGVQRLADAHDIVVKKANQCIAQKQGISEITVRFMDVLNAEIHRSVRTSRWTNLRVVLFALLALLAGVALGYGVATLR